MKKKALLMILGLLSLILGAHMNIPKVYASIPLIWGPYKRLSYTLTETRWAMVAANDRYDPNYIVVVFTDNLDGQFDWYFTKSIDGGATWTTPEIAVDPDFDVMESELYMAAIAMDDNGMVHMSFARQKTWWPRDTAPTGIYYARYDGTSWSLPITIFENMSPGYLCVGPNDITIGRNNTIHLAYGSDYPGNDNGDIWYCRSEDSGLTWTSPANINAFDWMDVGYPPSLAADDFGYVYYGCGDDWYSYDWWSELYFRRSPNNGVTWHSQMAISRRENGDRFPRLMCDNSGGVYVVWIGSPPDALFFKSSTDHGSNWTPYYGGIALTDTVPGMGDGYFAELDDHGFIHIVYQSTATGTTETYYMRIDTSGNIVNPPQIITPDDGYPSIPTALVLTGDQPCVATKDLKDGNWEAYFLRLTLLTEPWPMFHHDLYHTGYSTSIAPNTNNTMWNYTTDDIVYSSPVVTDDRVSVGSVDGKVYCLNATTGEHLWNYTTDSGVTSSPAVAYGRIYVGSWDRKIYCLNATTGIHIWNYTTGGSISSSPIVSYDNVYIGSFDHKIYCLNATTGMHIWNYTTGKGVFSSPAVAEGKVYVGSYDRKVYCLNATTGTHIWNYTTGDYVESSPTIVDSRVYIGSHETVYCLNANTGALIWNYITGGDVISSPAVAYGRIYVGSWDRKIYCLNATTGIHIWNYTTGDYVESSAAVADGKVYIGSGDGCVYCLNATTGTKIWSYKTGAAVSSSPAIAYGKVYVGSNDYHIYAFGPPTLRITTTTGGTTGPSPGTYLYMNGTIVDITATSSFGYHLDHWELDGVNVGSSNPILITMNTNHALHAVFSYDVIITAHCYTEGVDVNVSISMDGSPTGYNTSHTFINLTGTHDFTVPNADPSSHLFTQWDTGETSTTIAVSSGGTHIAHYQAKYNLTITTTTGGTTEPPPGNYSYWEATIVSIGHTTPSLGYLFDHWELDSANVGAPNPISVTMNTNHTLHAVFTWEGICNLTITTTIGGTTSPGPGTYSYTNGTEGIVTAVPTLGYVLDYWELDEINVGAPNPISMIMNRNHTLNAVFSWIGTYSLTITTTTGGTTNPAPGTYTYTNRTVVSVTAMPSLDYQFDHWELDGSNAGSTNPISVTMNTNHALKAFFVPILPPPVGGVIFPSDKLDLLAPYIGLASTIAVATVATAIYAKRVKRRNEKQ